MRYSIIDVGLAFAAGIGVSLALPPLDPRAVFLAAAGTAIIAVLGAHWRRGFLVLLLVAVALLGGLREQTTRLPLSRLYALAPSLRAVEGTIVSYPRIGDGYVSFVLAPTHIPGRIKVTWFLNGDRYEKVLYGDRVKVRGKGRIPPRFPDFDYRAYLARQGIFATFAVDTPDGVIRLGVEGNRRGTRCASDSCAGSTRSFPRRRRGSPTDFCSETEAPFPTPFPPRFAVPG